ncbi:MAG: biliverdin-producing heme oxygenase [Phycisphaerales bacterium]|nr:biliverdin-producing heme oxygenase [Phycisphaerales bacterium]
MPTTQLTPRLKDDNWNLHQIAEKGQTPSTMIKGTMPKETFGLALAQTFIIAKVFDDAVATIKDARPDLGALIHDEQYLTPYLREDLAYFGIDATAITPVPGAQRFIDAINEHRDDPCFLFGLHYVRLGACNGNRFVARKLRMVYKLAGTDGTRFLDPFGDTQRTKWISFKQGIDALDLSQNEQDRIFAGTQAAYVLTINLDYDEHHTAEQLLDMFGQSLDKKAFDEKHSVHISPEEAL